MAHVNARLNRYGRLLLIERVTLQGWPVAHAAKAMGISRQCAYRWLRRWRSEGLDGLVDRSSRPHSSPCRTPAEVEQAIMVSRTEHRRGPSWLAARHGVCPRTVSRILVRHAQPRLALLDPITGQLIRASKTTAVRYQCDQPGELVHMDVKKIGKIPDGGGWRAHGRAATATDRHHRAPVGYDYVHSVVDDASRLAYSEALPDEKGPTCAAFLHRALDHFAARGIPRVERLMTDNAWCYARSSRVRQLLRDLGIRHLLIPPRRPQVNGKVERFNRTMLEEWAYVTLYRSNEDRLRALPTWIDSYNRDRPHTALGGRPPVSRLETT